MSDFNWSGSWIGCEMSIEDRFSPVFKKHFNISDEIRTVKIYICGEGQFPGDPVMLLQHFSAWTIPVCGTGRRVILCGRMVMV
jgi:hypothetical protein